MGEGVRRGNPGSPCNWGRGSGGGTLVPLARWQGECALPLARRLVLPQPTFLFSLKSPMRFSASTPRHRQGFYLLDVRYPQVHGTQPGGATTKVRRVRRAVNQRKGVRRQATFSGFWRQVHA